MYTVTIVKCNYKNQNENVVFVDHSKPGEMNKVRWF